MNKRLFLFLLITIYILPYNIFANILDENIAIEITKKANEILGNKEAKLLKAKSYIIDYPIFEQGLKDGYSRNVPESIEEIRENITEEYVQWIFATNNSTFSPPKLPKKIIEKMSYFLGVDYGRDFKSKYLDLNAEEFTLGIKNVLENKPALEEDEETLKQFYQIANHLREEASNNKSLELSQNSGFSKKLDKGISYSLINIGKEPISPTDLSIVTIKYIISEIDDNRVSYVQVEKQETIAMKDLAEGVRISLHSMQKGERSIFNIPTALLFTDMKKKLTLNTNTLLDIELIDIKKDFVQQESLKSKIDSLLVPESLQSKNLIPKRSRKK